MRQVREGFKNPSHGKYPWYSPFSAKKFLLTFWQEASRDGRGSVPPFTAEKKSVKKF